MRISVGYRSFLSLCHSFFVFITLKSFISLFFEKKHTPKKTNTHLDYSKNKRIAIHMIFFGAHSLLHVISASETKISSLRNVNRNSLDCCLFVVFAVLFFLLLLLSNTSINSCELFIEFLKKRIENKGQMNRMNNSF